MTIPNAVYVEGKVAMFYKVPAPKAIRVGDGTYIFSCEHGISMAFIEEKDVQPLLDYRGGCCGQKQQVVFLATEIQYSHWKDGNGGR